MPRIQEWFKKKTYLDVWNGNLIANIFISVVCYKNAE